MPRITTATATTAQLAELVDVPVSTIRGWRWREILPAAGVDEGGNGRGRQATYGVLEMAWAVVVAQCSRQGVALAKLAELAPLVLGHLMVRKVAERGFDGWVLVDVAETTAELVERDQLTAALAKLDGAAVVVPLVIGDEE